MSGTRVLAGSISLLLVGVLLPGAAGAAPSSGGPCDSLATDTGYPQLVIGDHPLLYYRLDDGSSTVACDASGNGKNATYQAGYLGALTGAIRDDADAAAHAEGLTIRQTGDTLPSGSNPRTLEAWIYNVNAGFDLFKYGDVTDNQGFIVSVGNDAGSVTVTAGDSTQTLNSVTATPNPGLKDGWHLLDVTYGAGKVRVYQDGQVVVARPLAVSTVVPGQAFAVSGSFGCCSTHGVDEVAAYGTALSAAAIAAHWTRGETLQAQPQCLPTPTSPYTQGVLGDAPSVYFRLGDLSGDPTARVAFDASPACQNGAYQAGIQGSRTGGLIADPDSAVTSDGLAVAQSGNALPSGASTRTLEAWVYNVNAGFDLFSYGDVAAGKGMVVNISNDGGSISVNSGAGSPSFSATAAPQLNIGWHLLDVTYDGTNMAIYQDGQLLDSGALALDTTVPGQGLKVSASYGCCSSHGLDEVAIYPSALTPHAIDVHWTRGQLTDGSPQCLPPASGPYSTAVVADSPLAYWRLDEPGHGLPGRVALDSSGHCANAAYQAGAVGGFSGALGGDDDPGLHAEGLALASSGEYAPAGASTRTLEAWVYNVNAGFDLFSYGDVAAGKGMVVNISNDGGSISVNSGAGSPSFSATAAPQLNIGWHLLDVTYDGTNMAIYQDGQLLDSGALALDTTVPGQGLKVSASYGCCSSHGLDEVAIYPSALTSTRIQAHFDAQYNLPPGESMLAGSLTGGGGGVPGARIEACPSGGGACFGTANVTDGGGHFSVLVPDGTYAITAIPPEGSGFGRKTVGPVTVPPSKRNIVIDFGNLTPPQGSLTTPGGPSQAGTVPTVNWGDPTSYSISGRCQGGIGTLTMGAVNTSTGQLDRQTVPLLETTSGSGTYRAQIPPLAPLHGLAGADDRIMCPGHTKVLPDGGPPAGGTTVLLAGSGFTGAKAVSFGSAPASSFEVLNDQLIRAVSPSGAGTVSVTVTTAQDSSVAVGDFSYFAVTGLGTTSGPVDGGTTVTISGQGFSDGDSVLFGTQPAGTVNVVSPSEIQAVVPVGVGTVQVQVLNGFAASQMSGSTSFTYQGGPQSASTIVEGTGPQGAVAYAAQVNGFCSDSHTSTQYVDIGQGQLCDGASRILNEFGPKGVINGAILGAALTGLGALVFGLEALPVIVTVVPVILALNVLCNFVTDDHCFQFDVFHFFIDPSGTVVDANGVPLQNASVTLLKADQVGGGFSPVPASSSLIDPAVNPETTNETGEFNWDALAGGYRVRASHSGCHAPGQPTEETVSTDPFEIPPPKVGIVLQLRCAAGSIPTPKVRMLTPAAGTAGGGAQVEVIGSALGGASAVRFGSALATGLRVLSPYALLVTAPAGSGTVHVTVTTPGGISSRNAGNKYTYVRQGQSRDAPALVGVTPNRGPVTGGTRVTISGTNLSNAVEVDFGNQEASSMRSLSDTQIRAVAPAGLGPGTVNVTVTTTAGTSSIVKADRFAYGATRLTLASSANPALVGSRVVFTATVAPTDGGGTLVFTADGTLIAGCKAKVLAPVPSGFAAMCATTKLSRGTHVIKALYSGDQRYLSSSGKLPGGEVIKRTLG
jgi:hypothetical protein